jgi:hypothetical protein
MTISEPPNWNDTEPLVQFLIDKVVPSDEKVFWQKANEKLFTEGHLSVELMSVLAHQKWTRCFENSKNGWCHLELHKMSQFFAISHQNANLEQVIWTKNKNMLIGESLRGLLFLQYNFIVIFYKDFHTFLKSSVQLLKNQING